MAVVSRYTRFVMTTCVALSLAACSVQAEPSREIETSQRCSPEPAAPGHRQVHLVDEPRLQILSNGGHASSKADVLSTGSSEGLTSAARIPPATK